MKFGCKAFSARRRCKSCANRSYLSYLICEVGPREALALQRLVPPVLPVLPFGLACTRARVVLRDRTRLPCAQRAALRGEISQQLAKKVRQVGQVGLAPAAYRVFTVLPFLRGRTGGTNTDEC
jgi:hypothetical protein